MGKEKQEEVFVIGAKRAWERIKYSGIYDLQRLLNLLKKYLLDRNYDLDQKEHTEKITTAGKESKIEWEAFRRVSDYVKFVIGFEVWILRNVEVVIEEDGRKLRRQKGDIELRFRASIKKNYRGPFGKGNAGEFLRQTYEKYIIKSVLEDYEDKIDKECRGMIEEAKEILETFKSR